MAGLGEILEENARLREASRDKDAQLVAQGEQLAAQGAELAGQRERLALLEQQVESLKASNERFALHFEFLEKRRQLAAAERFDASQRQSPLFEGVSVTAPPRDPEQEKKGNGEGGKPKPKEDGRKTSKHPRKGRRDVSALDFPRRKVTAPVSPSACEDCGLARELIEPRITHRVGWEPGRWVVNEVHQEQCKCPCVR